jgi:hypothetical protein
MTAENVDAPECGAYLLAIVEVERADRIQCQAGGCGHSVYKRIHIVLAGLEFRVLGSQCYERLYGQTNAIGQAPEFGTGSGRLLTPEERLVLVENTAAFIESLEAERAELEAPRCVASSTATRKWVGARISEPDCAGT